MKTETVRDVTQSEYAFECSEDQLTNVLFYNCAPEHRFVGTKADARVLARKMLAADNLLEAVENAFEQACIEVDDGELALRALSWIRPILATAITKAKG